MPHLFYNLGFISLGKRNHSFLLFWDFRPTRYCWEFFCGRSRRSAVFLDGISVCASVCVWVSVYFWSCTYVCLHLWLCMCAQVCTRISLCFPKLGLCPCSYLCWITAAHIENLCQCLGTIRFCCVPMSVFIWTSVKFKPMHFAEKMVLGANISDMSWRRFFHETCLKSVNWSPGDLR